MVSVLEWELQRSVCACLRTATAIDYHWGDSSIRCAATLTDAGYQRASRRHLEEAPPQEQKASDDVIRVGISVSLYPCSYIT